MNLTKAFSVIQRFSARTLILNERTLPCMSFRRFPSTATNTSVEETEFQESTVDETKKVMKDPFLKSLFTGNVVSEFLEYPEYPTAENIEEVYNLVAPVEEYILNCVDSKKIDEMKEIPVDTISEIKKFNLFGLKVPKHLGGFEVDDKCVSYYFESIGTDCSLTTALTCHYRALYTLLKFGTEEQKEKFLPKMCSGELNVAVCIAENPTILNISDMNTIASPSGNGDWILNGKKIWVADGVKADLFLVFASTIQGEIKSNSTNGLTLFVIDKNTPGIECSDNISQLGTRGVGLCDVMFKDVIVPKENIIGEIGSGGHVAAECITNGRLGSAAASVGFLKNLLNNLAHYTIHTKVEDKPLYFQEYYQKHLGAIAADIYALESMVYLTAGMKDMYDMDLSLEEIAVKIFSMEKVVEIVDLAANLVGGSAYIKGSPVERSIRDARSYLLHDVVPVNVSKLHIATNGLHHAGVTIKSEIKKARNPLHFPGFAIRNMFNERNVTEDKIKVPELLRLNLHPSLSGDADRLEACAVRLECIIKNLFTRWGVEIVDRHMDLIKLTDCIIHMFAMAAVLGRASRSYCIGLNNSNYDLSVSNIVCGVKSEEIKKIIRNIHNGPMESYDSPSIAIGEQVAMQKGYFFQHPLARNY